MRCLEPWRGMLWRAPILLIIAAGLMTLAGCSSVLGLDIWCDGDERAVFGEFRQYGGAQAAPEANRDLGSCAAYYDTPDAPQPVFDYFHAELTQRGWTVQPWAWPGSAPPGGALLTAQRAGFQYLVLYETFQPGTHLAVHVRRRS